MPFEEITRMEGRRELVRRVLSEEVSMAQACREAGVSRPTGYLWVERAKRMGQEEIQEESRRPKRVSRATAPEVVEALLALKEHKPKRGAKKLVAKLWPSEEGVTAPICVRTADRILKRHGLVRERGAAPVKVGSFEREACNELAQMDHKGMGKRPRPYVPFTLIDDHSRYCLAFEPLPDERWESAWEVLWRVFGENGLPESILSDNGSCFHSRRSAGPSHLEARLWLLGIKTIHGRRGHPQTQGKVERLHRTLGEETPMPLRSMTIEQAREVLPAVVHEYNWERPHEALGMRMPGAVYTPSERRRPERLPEHQLSESALKRKVDAAGLLYYRSNRYRVGKGLTGEHVEIREEATGEAVYYAAVRIASLNTIKV